MMQNNLIKSIIPLANILKVNILDEELVFADYLEKLSKKVERYEKKLEKARLNKVIEVNQKIVKITSKIYCNRNTVEL